jgi:hypothetical protein
MANCCKLILSLAASLIHGLHFIHEIPLTTGLTAKVTLVSLMEDGYSLAPLFSAHFHQDLASPETLYAPFQIY